MQHFAGSFVLAIFDKSLSEMLNIVFILLGVVYFRSFGRVSQSFIFGQCLSVLCIFSFGVCFLKEKTFVNVSKLVPDIFQFLLMRIGLFYSPSRLVVSA